MKVTISVSYPPSKLTFELVGDLIGELERYKAELSFDGYSGRMTVHTSDPAYHEALRMITDFKLHLDDIRCEGMKSFTEYFGSRLPMDIERATVYCQMCKEGRI